MASSYAESSRAATQLRPVNIEYEILPQADGSASFSFGHQSALGVVNGPIEVRIREELTDRATLEINYIPLDGVAGISASSFTTTLKSALSCVVLLGQHPRSLIQLTLQTTNHAATKTLPPQLLSSLSRPLSSFRRQTIRPSIPHPDAALPVSERATLINAAMLAMIQAGIACSATICAVSVASVPAELQGGFRRQSQEVGDQMEKDAKKNGVLIVDPDPSEESFAMNSHVFAFACSGQVVSSDTMGSKQMHMDGEDPSEAGYGDFEAKLVLSQSVERIDVEEYRDAVALARQAAKSIHKRVHASIQRQYSIRLQ